MGGVVSDRDHVALVTGASSGLGAEVTVALARRGCSVIAVGRDRERLADVAARAGEGVEPLAGGDLGDYEAVAALTDEVLRRGPVHSLVHAAGGPAFSAIADIDGVLLDEALSANLRGLVFLSARLVEPMKQRGGGTIVGVLSTAALTGRAQEGAYAAAKWAARGFLECLRADCKGTGVRVISVFPGGMRTPFWSRQAHLSPDLETYMDPAQVAVPIVDAVLGTGGAGYVSTLVIERK